MRKTTTKPTDEIVPDAGAGEISNLTPPDEPLPGMAPPADPDPAPGRARKPDPRRRHDKPSGNPPGRPKASSSKAPGRPSNHDRLARALTDQHVFAGSMLMMFSPLTGRAMIEQAEQCAESLATWADTNPKVARALNRMVDGAGAVGVLAAYAPIAMALYQDLAIRDARAASSAPSSPASSSPASSSAEANGEASIYPDAVFEPGFMAPNSA